MSNLVLALDIGGTKLEAALVNENGDVLEDTRHSLPTGNLTELQVEANLFEAIKGAAGNAPGGTTIMGIGIGTAGPIDTNRGTISPVNIPAWQQYPIIERIKATTSLPIKMILDGQAITIAEHWKGSGRGSNTMMGMIVSTGIGGGIIAAGRLLTGHSGNSGHIGHLLVPITEQQRDPDPSESPIPDPYVLERNASGPSSVRRAVRSGLTALNGAPLTDGKALGALLDSPDTAVRESAEKIVRESGHMIGQAIVGATALLELEKVVIAGGFSKVSPILFQSIRDVTQNHYFEFVRNVEVVPSAIVDDAPLLGVAGLWIVPEYLT